MELASDSWTNGDRIPERFAAGRLMPDGSVAFSENLNPHLAWRDLPGGTASMALICHDFDVPCAMDDINRHDREVPSDLARIDFFHWLLIDLPPQPAVIAEGEYSRGFQAGGKRPAGLAQGVRQGLNDYTGFFKNDPTLAGQYFGYDGPFPPFNDSLIHHYVFTLYALNVPRLAVEGDFTGQDVRRALAGHVLGEATYSGTYTLNRRLVAAR
jgi:Raf kinase inhibitor-like YbhB/YbcL family protein